MFGVAIGYDPGKKSFTVADAVAIQARQLEEWKWKLNDRTYNALVVYITKDNEKASAPSHVKRGVDMDNFIHNYHPF